MYVCVRIVDGSLVGSQSVMPAAGAMIAQAVQDFGGDASDYEEREVQAQEFAALLAAANAPTLEQAKAAKLAAIQAEKNRARDGGFTVGGVLFDSDAGARLAYLELENKLSSDPTFTTSWKASDGVWVTMDATLYAQVKAAGTAHISACFAWQAAREVEVAAAQTVADVQAVSAVYGG